MDSAKQQLIDQLKKANNVLVTVRRDPSVDQLSACIGLALLLNKQGKHAAAVFSGEVPSTLEFLQPDETLEKNTDSLRDFIISLDRSKADKLRYKVEDNVVRIFITPYKTSISQEDLEFSEGDFNVDLVIALGVQQQEDLDQAITAHGRILHDATVACINTSPDGGLGTINWHDPQASSLSELVTELAQAGGGDNLDKQIATALLTGIVSETDRFSNDKTSSQTMSASAALMAAGANQQLVASKLEEPITTDAGQKIQDSEEDSSEDGDGVMKIDHDNDQPPEGEPPAPAVAEPAPEPSETPEAPPTEEPTPPADDQAAVSDGPKLVTEPPTMGGQLTANSSEEKLEAAVDPLSMPVSEPPQLLDRKPDAGPEPAQPEPPVQPEPSAPDGPQLTPPPAAWTPPAPPSPEPSAAPTDDKTLAELEKSVDSPHLQQENVQEARDEVSDAISSGPAAPAEPIQALGAQPMGGDLHPSADENSIEKIVPGATHEPDTADPNAPPPVPPPIPFQFGDTSGQTPPEPPKSQ